MRFLVHAVIKPGTDPKPLVPAEHAHVQKLIAARTVEESYLRADRTGAYIVMTAADLATAQEVMQKLPMAEAGILDFTFVELVTPAT